ncbi:MAG: hypothetical protein QXL96_09645 [Ignisphaera sp.]
MNRVEQPVLVVLVVLLVLLLMVASRACMKVAGVSYIVIYGVVNNGGFLVVEVEHNRC